MPFGIAWRGCPPALSADSQGAVTPNSERMRSNVAGASCETIASLPFGDGLSSTGSCGDPSTRHFTGKERDAESGLDDFGARYYSSQFGRFVSADWSVVPVSVPYADLTNPQGTGGQERVKKCRLANSTKSALKNLPSRRRMHADLNFGIHFGSPRKLRESIFSHVPDGMFPRFS
jgi:RHS repeat-associated protein